MTKIEDIEGIGAAYAKKLIAAGIKTTDNLLEAAATPAGRKNLAEKTGISEKMILEWVNLADLFRIKGIGEEYSDLLGEAGVEFRGWAGQVGSQSILWKECESIYNEKHV